MNIVITENYRIKSDPQNVIVEQRKMVDPTRAPGWTDLQGADPTPYEKWTELTYHTSVASAVKAITRREINASKATSISDLRADIRRIEARVDRALQGN